MRKQTLTWLSLFLVMAVTLSACGTAGSAESTSAESEAGTSSELSGTLSISGAFALYPMMTVWAEEFTKLHPDVQFDVQGGGVLRS